MGARERVAELLSLRSDLRGTGHPAPCSSSWEDWESPTLGTGDTGKMTESWEEEERLVLRGGGMGNNRCGGHWTPLVLTIGGVAN